MVPLIKQLGKSLTLIDSIGNGFAWLFAVSGKDSTNVMNGFQLTGGALNRTVSSHIGDRYSIALSQQFTDTENQDSFNINMVISGTIFRSNNTN